MAGERISQNLTAEGSVPAETSGRKPAHWHVWEAFSHF